MTDDLPEEHKTIDARSKLKEKPAPPQPTRRAKLERDLLMLVRSGSLELLEDLVIYAKDKYVKERWAEAKAQEEGASSRIESGGIENLLVLVKGDELLCYNLRRGEVKAIVLT